MMLACIIASKPYLYSLSVIYMLTYRTCRQSSSDITNWRAWPFARIYIYIYI